MTTLDTLKQARDALLLSNARIIALTCLYFTDGIYPLPKEQDVEMMKRNDECIALLNAEIARLESEPYEPAWIPTSVRLPPFGKAVYVSTHDFRDGYAGEYQELYSTTAALQPRHEDSPEDGEVIWINEDGEQLNTAFVAAWCMLPQEYYKPTEQEIENAHYGLFTITYGSITTTKPTL